MSLVCVLHEIDGLCGCFSLIHSYPEVVSSLDSIKFLAPEVSKLATSQQYVRYRLASCTLCIIPLAPTRAPPSPS